MILAGAADNPIVFIVIILAFFGAIVGGVIAAKKYLKPFKTEEEVKSDKEIAEEELNRILVDIEDEKPVENDEVSHEDDTLARTLGEIDDPEAIKAMEEYAKAHENEANEGENE